MKVIGLPSGVILVVRVHLGARLLHLTSRQVGQLVFQVGESDCIGDTRERDTT